MRFKILITELNAHLTMIVQMIIWWLALLATQSKSNQKNTILQIGNTQVGLLIDSSIVCSILNESLATEVVNNSTLARWLTTAPALELKTFANEPIPVIGMMQAPIESKGWRIEDAEFVVVKDGLKSLIGRDLS